MGAVQACDDIRRGEIKVALGAEVVGRKIPLSRSKIGT
jgi:hypothetical protein